MKFVLTITCDNAAFGEPDDQTQRLDEVARILRYAADTVENGGIGHGYEEPLRDINGNTVGKFELLDEPEVAR